GVPVLTMQGSNYISHLGESIMQNAGLPDWIAAEEEDYIDKAVAFSRNIKGLAKLRSNLRAQVLNSPLFDAPRFARDLEDTLWGMWEMHRH
ncbi:MAG: glycosyltransferase, partial [Gallionella sp.]